MRLCILVASLNSRLISLSQHSFSKSATSPHSRNILVAMVVWETGILKASTLIYILVMHLFVQSMTSCVFCLSFHSYFHLVPNQVFVLMYVCVCVCVCVCMCVCMYVAEKAILEMNRKEKDIVRGYLSAIKYASQLESRVRIMLIGDTGSGQATGLHKKF